jgi:uncharacterized protein (TIGR03089 family)
MTSPTRTVVEALAGYDAPQPVITFYDDATGERLDLSAATLTNWVAKTANLLVDGHGLGTGDGAAVELPPHWLTAAVLLGCWSAGLAVTRPDDRAEIAFVTGDSPTRAPDTYALSLAPLAAPYGPPLGPPGPPPGTLDFVREVRPYGDHFNAPVRASDLALADGTTHAELGALTTAPAGRLLIDAAADADPRRWLVAPLLAGASIVLCVNLDPTRLSARLANERAVAWP